MNPLCALALLALCGIVITGSRRAALLAFLAGALYIPQYQAVQFGLNLFPTRVLEIALLLRVTLRSEWLLYRFNKVDWAVLWLYLYSTLVFLLRSHEGVAFQLGVMVDAFLSYFCCRALIDSPESFRWVLRKMVLLLIPFTFFVVVERLTAQSPLAFMRWGAWEGGYWARASAVRCFGPFRHPSLLGTVGVGFIPIFIGMAFRPEDRKVGVLGSILGLIIVWTTNSGGPFSGVAAGFVAWLGWVLRRRMRMVRWGMVSFLVMAAILMKAPIWYLIAHVSSVTGGDGWHRAYLMDVSFQNFGKWWLAGMPVADTADWFPYSLTATGGADITNQFISFGITAGIGATALFVLLLKRAFDALGNAIHAVRDVSAQPSEAEFLLWGLGVMLAAHIVNWLGISYFDQTYAFWFAQLAAISSLSDWYVNHSVSEPALKEEMTRSEMEQPIPATAQ